MSKKIDPRDIKWFGPLWRRIAIVAVLVVWSAMEWRGGEQFWGMMTLVVLAYAVWKLFLDFPNAAEIADFEKAEAEKAAIAAKTQAAAETEDASEAPESNADKR